jgi:hypothetical protein
MLNPSNPAVKNQILKKQPLKDKAKFEKGKTALKEQHIEKGMLERLYIWFDYLNFDAMLLPVKDENTVETLIISVGEKTADDGGPDLRPDYLKDHTMVQIYYINDLVNALQKVQNPELVAPDRENYYILQFYTGMPIKFRLEKFWKVQQLLMAFNEILPIGSLGLDKNKQIYYRYTLITDVKEIELATAYDILQLIDFFMRRFRRKITHFVEGRARLQDILDELESGKYINW